MVTVGGYLVDLGEMQAAGVLEVVDLVADNRVADFVDYEEVGGG